MNWSALTGLGGLCLGAISLVWTIHVARTKDSREKSSTDLLNLASVVQTAFTGSKDTAEFLHNLFTKCTERCEVLQADLDEARETITAQDAELAELRAKVARLEAIEPVVREHEKTIVRHDKTLGQVARRSDLVDFDPDEQERRLIGGTDGTDDPSS